MIEWTDATWNPVVGCTPVSPGCLNCYAATMARRLEAMGKDGYEPRCTSGAASFAEIASGAVRTHRIAEVRDGRAVFTGDVRLVESRLEEPLRWRKPRRVFVNSMSDLFHERVPFEFIYRVFAMMALCPQHTFQVLTKRPERMAEYMAGFDVNQLCGAVQTFRGLLNLAAERRPRLAPRIDEPGGFPFPNVWLGTSCENQATADERIPHLLRCPAAVRFLSCEPLLGPIDLTNIGEYDGRCVSALIRHPIVDDERGGQGVDWIIVGGESGPKARACRVEWIAAIVEQCRVAGVPCFVKQLGTRPVSKHDVCDWRNGWPDGTAQEVPTGAIPLRDRKGADPSEWPPHLRVREWPSQNHAGGVR